jgi:hypothetical protein
MAVDQSTRGDSRDQTASELSRSGDGRSATGRGAVGSRVRCIDALSDRDAGVEQPESCNDGWRGGSLRRGANGARRAVRGRFDMTGEIVVTKRQQPCREDVQRENELESQADGSAREPAGSRHLQIRLYAANGGLAARHVKGQCGRARCNNRARQSITYNIG